MPRRTTSPKNRRASRKRMPSDRAASPRRRTSGVSVYGTPLRACSTPGTPTTGYARDATCRTNSRDRGAHLVCLQDLDDNGFCQATGQSNWCEGKDNWCVCEWAFDEAVARKGCDEFRVQCDATNQRALDDYDASGRTAAAACIRSQCGLDGARVPSKSRRRASVTSPTTMEL